MYLIERMRLVLSPYLLDRLGRYLYRRTITRAIEQGKSIGDYLIVPKGYIGHVLHKKPGELADPLDQSETLGWKLVRKKV